MLKRTVKYIDFDGEQREDVFYFNISKTEMLDMEVKYRAGFNKRLQMLLDTQDMKALVEQFKELMLLAYGEKSEDGRFFTKSPEMRAAFEQSAAFDTLFMEFFEDEKKASEFIRAVLPADLVADRVQDKPMGLPNPPPPPS